VQDKVTSGEIAVYEGAKISKLSPEEQKEAVSKPKERKKSAPKPKKESDPASSFDSVPLFEYEKLQAKYDEMESNYQVMAAELESCNAIRNGEQMDHFKKLNQQLVAVTASRDEWQNKCSELTRQVNYLNAKLKKLKE
jgi:chromosome segregation ATPase